MGQFKSAPRRRLDHAVALLLTYKLLHRHNWIKGKARTNSGLGCRGAVARLTQAAWLVRLTRPPINQRVATRQAYPSAT